MESQSHKIGFLKMLILISIVSILILTSCNDIGTKQNILFAYVDPLDKVFKEMAFFPQKEAVADVARGEHASFQFAFRSFKNVRDLKIDIRMDQEGQGELGSPEWGFVDYVRIGRRALDPATDRLNSVSGYYPDPIIVAEKKNLKANETQPIWVSIPIPKNAKPGTYTGEITIKGKSGLKSIRLSGKLVVNVYSPVINKTSLWVTNWFGNEFSYLNKGEPVEPYSEQYWGYLKLLARKMAEYRQNVALISPLRLAEYKIDENLNYNIDFARFIKTVNIFVEEGVLGRIEGGHIGSRDSTWSSQFMVFVPVEENDSIILEKFKISNDTARIFYKQFFEQLIATLNDKGWKEIYMQHIADEPIEPNMESYIEISKYIRELIPDIPIIEACHTNKLENSISVWVPQLNFFHTDYEFYSNRAEKGDEIWFYTCLSPKGEYANRFIDQPLIKTRILHWINFRFNAPGYLHWGLNYWTASDDPYNETTGIIKESGNVLPGGDAWIVYPADGEVLSSIRLEAMRDGIVDYELLKMLAEKDEELAKELARQVVFGFTTYETNTESFRSIRKQILNILSEE